MFLIFDLESWYVLDISVYCLFEQNNKVTLSKFPEFINILYKLQQILEQPVWNLGFI
jgi:hypothetical protein